MTVRARSAPSIVGSAPILRPCLVLGVSPGNIPPRIAPKSRI